jgi:trafficking protein particle complex subunit 4|eukprot:GSChrysophyteH1.ASY1.ANO1.781.1 assembled CDS
MPLLQLFIINRNGGLVYNRKLSAYAPNKNVNDMMVLGSTFHSLFEIVKQVAPCPSGGMETIDTSTFRLKCRQTLTGMKFVATATPDTRIEELDALCQTAYELYSDYALKNPFYELEQPINCSLFSTEINKAIIGKSYLNRMNR